MGGTSRKGGTKWEVLVEGVQGGGSLWKGGSLWEVSTL